MKNAEKFEQVFGVGQANLAIADASWWDREYPKFPERNFKIIRDTVAFSVETIRDYCEERLCNNCRFGCDTEEDPYRQFECYLKMVDPCDWILEKEDG